MYTIEINVNPVTFGFGLEEVKYNGVKLSDLKDTTIKDVKGKKKCKYTVERKFFHVIIWDSYDYDIGGEAWCPCSHEIFNEADYSQGGHFKVDDGDYVEYGKRRVIDNLMGRASDVYGVKVSDKEEGDIRKTSALVNGHTQSRQRFYGDYVKQGYKCRLGTPPNDPHDDPFLPEKFRQILDTAYIGYRFQSNGSYVFRYFKRAES